MVLKSRHPKRIVVAVPVSAADAAERIRAEADELVALDVPEYFMAVGEHYEQFPQLSDEDVIRFMNRPLLALSRNPALLK
jgi:putative phosphoribosyl transferase